MKNENDKHKMRVSFRLGKDKKISNRSVNGLTVPVPDFPIEPVGFYCFAFFTLFLVF